MNAREAVEAALPEVIRAPSAHNTQPARFRWVDGSILLFEDPRRSLPVGDPDGRDQATALGATIEGWSLALSRRGWQIQSVEREFSAPPPAGLRPVARLVLGPGGVEDPLAVQVLRRSTFRGRFAAPWVDDRPTLEREFSRDPGVRAIFSPDELRHVGALVDRANVESFRHPGMYDELWRWMRLSPSHPDYRRDGLNAEALQLPPALHPLWTRLLAPSRDARFDRWRLSSLLVGESAQVRSAIALLALAPPNDASPLDIGRWFYRTWLRVTACGLALCPMSVLADTPSIRAELTERWSIPASRRLMHVWRVGRVSGESPTSPRLPLAEWWV